MTNPNRRDDLDDVDIDPDEALAQTDDERTSDPGADLEEQGVPPDDRTGMGEVPDPERPAAPADEPLGAVAFGTTGAEMAEGESLDDKLRQEQPDRPPGEDDVAPADEAAVQVHEISPLAPDQPPQADESPRPEHELAVDPDELATADEPEPSAPDEADW